MASETTESTRTPIPDHIEKVRELKKEEEPIQEFTPESIQEDESVAEKLPVPTGYRMLGPDAYKDKNKFPNGAWCQERDWVIFGRYAGARIKIDGGDLRLLNDDEILAVVNNPEDVE